MLDLIGENQDIQTEFVACAMQKNPQSCAIQAKVNLKKVDFCVKGARGLQLQLIAEKESEAIINTSMFVPTVSFSII